jgi:hypothetical protein
MSRIEPVLPRIDGGGDAMLLKFSKQVAEYGVLIDAVTGMSMFQSFYPLTGTGIPEGQFNCPSESARRLMDGLYDPHRWVSDVRVFG